MKGGVPWGRHRIAGPKHLYRIRLLLKQIKRHLGPKGVVVDLGCGSGTILFRLTNMGYDVTGVDTSEEYVRSINDGLDRAGLFQRAAAVRAPAEHTGLEGGMADGVVLSEVLEHLPKEGPVLSEARRLLKPGGLLFVTVPADRSLWTGADEAAGHYRRYERQELKTLIEEAKFNMIALCPWGQTVTKAYEKLIFSPWMSSRGRRGEDPGAGGFLGRLAKAWAVSYPLSIVLGLDDLLPWPRSGVGWVAVARKPLT